HPTAAPCPYTTLFRSETFHQPPGTPVGRRGEGHHLVQRQRREGMMQRLLRGFTRITQAPARTSQTPADLHCWSEARREADPRQADRKSTRLNSSHVKI